MRRLAQYRPFERGGLDLRAVLRDLVLAVAAIDDGRIESLLECRKSFAALWSLEVEIDELRPVVEGLADEGSLEKVGKGFRLSSSLLVQMQANAQEWDDIEKRAFREWELSVRQSRPGLDDDAIEVLQSDLREWLHLIITRHGAEAALMLYPEDERANQFFDELDAHGFDLLPGRDDELHALRSEALPIFVRHPTPDQRRFLALLLNTSFYMTVLTIDPAAKQLVRAQMEGQRLYLDTNFLYAVLGAAPPEEVYSSRRLVQMSKDLGFALAATPWTLDELRTSIARSRRDIGEQQKFIRPELAETMLSASGDKGFNRLFWQTYKDKKTKPKDVFDRLEHFEQELAGYGIVEMTEGCTRVEQQDERVKLYASLVGAERWPYQKEPVVLEHDAKCRMLVEQLRGDGNLSLSNARYWFLTYDNKLPRFAKRVPDNGDAVPSMPFCISPSAWVQIIRALTPRTDDFDRTVVDLLTSPFVGYRRAVNPSVVQEVVGRMDHMEDASPEMAVAVLTDTAAISEIQDAVSTGDEDAVEGAVKGVYSSKAREMQEALVAGERRLVEMQESLAKSEAAVEAARESEREHAQTQVQGERQAWEGQRKSLEDQLSDAQRARDDGEDRANRADQRIQAMEAKLDVEERRRTRNRRIAIGALLSTLGLALAVMSPLVLFSAPWAIGGGMVGGVSLALLGVRIAVGKAWGGEVVAWGGLICAIAAVAVAIIVDLE